MGRHSSGKREVAGGPSENSERHEGSDEEDGKQSSNCKLQKLPSSIWWQTYSIENNSFEDSKKCSGLNEREKKEKVVLEKKLAEMEEELRVF